MKDLVVHDSQLVTNHALGLVDDLESLRALEAHLAGCAQCCQEWEDVRDTLALAAEHIPPEFFDTTRADPDDDLIFQRTVRAVRQEKRAKARHRWLRPVAAAAMALIALIGAGFAVGRATAPNEPPAVVHAEGGRTIQGTGVGGRRWPRRSPPLGSRCGWR